MAAYRSSSLITIAIYCLGSITSASPYNKDDSSITLAPRMPVTSPKAAATTYVCSGEADPDEGANNEYCACGDSGKRYPVTTQTVSGSTIKNCEWTTTPTPLPATSTKACTSTYADGIVYTFAGESLGICTGASKAISTITAIYTAAAPNIKPSTNVEFAGQQVPVGELKGDALVDPLRSIIDELCPTVLVQSTKQSCNPSATKTINIPHIVADGVVETGNTLSVWMSGSEYYTDQARQAIIDVLVFSVNTTAYKHSSAGQGCVEKTVLANGGIASGHCIEDCGTGTFDQCNVNQGVNVERHSTDNITDASIQENIGIQLKYNNEDGSPWDCGAITTGLGLVIGIIPGLDAVGTVLGELIGIIGAVCS